MAWVARGVGEEFKLDGSEFKAPGARASYR